MAKMEYIKKTTTKVCGVLDEREDGTLIIRVEDKDNVREFEVKEIVDSMIGTLVTFSNEEIL